eukprot:7086681-Prymnesium_polylepis.1
MSRDACGMCLPLVVAVLLLPLLCRPVPYVARLQEQLAHLLGPEVGHQLSHALFVLHVSIVFQPCLHTRGQLVQKHGVRGWCAPRMPLVQRLATGLRAARAREPGSRPRLTSSWGPTRARPAHSPIRARPCSARPCAYTASTAACSTCPWHSGWRSPRPFFRRPRSSSCPWRPFCPSPPLAPPAPRPRADQGSVVASGRTAATPIAASVARRVRLRASADAPAPPCGPGRPAGARSPALRAPRAAALSTRARPPSRRA